jgi:hypothetical protein
MFNHDTLSWVAKMRIQMKLLSSWRSVAWQEFEALAITMLRFAR